MSAGCAAPIRAAGIDGGSPRESAGDLPLLWLDSSGFDSARISANARINLSSPELCIAQVTPPPFVAAPQVRQSCGRFQQHCRRSGRQRGMLISGIEPGRAGRLQPIIPPTLEETGARGPGFHGFSRSRCKFCANPAAGMPRVLLIVLAVQIVTPSHERIRNPLVPSSANQAATHCRRQSRRLRRHSCLEARPLGALDPRRAGYGHGAGCSRLRTDMGEMCGPERRPAEQRLDSANSSHSDTPSPRVRTYAAPEPSYCVLRGAQ